MKRILILYGTRRGTTTQTVELIAKILTEQYPFNVEALNVRDYRSIRKHLDEFDAIILGSSIQSRLWVSKALRILKSMKKWEKPFFVFVTAGGTMNMVAKYGNTKEEVIQLGTEKYIDKYLLKYKIEPQSKAVFGGRVMKKEQVRYESWNAEDIVNWANEVGKLIN